MRVVAELVEPERQLLLRLHEEVAELREVGAALVDEGHGHALPPRAARAPDAVHVVLDGLRDVEVHHEAHVLDVEAPLRDVGGDEDVLLPRAEEVHRRVALVLALVAVDGEGVELLLAELLREGVRRPLALDEDQDAGPLPVRRRYLLQPLEEALPLLDLAHHLYSLPDVWVRLRHDAADGDLDGLLLAEVPRELLDLPRPRRRPHERLPVRADLRDDPPELGLEAHVQHPVGLVEHEVGKALQARDVVVQQVQQPAGCRDADLRAAPEPLDLGAPGHASVHHDVADADRLAEPERLHLDLQRQLSGRREHQGNRAVAWSQRRLRQDVDHRRQQVRERLAAARLGQAHHVVAGERDRPPDRLDRGGRREADVPQLLHDLLWEAGVVEVFQGFRCLACALNRGAIPLQEALNLLRGHALHVRVLPVEVLLKTHELLVLPIHRSQARAGIVHCPHGHLP
mmetsp:Transcript_53070/g.148993  ORF Transcript_53070/g.148993 Transcript_53070/m.148993 type:complete len:457 (-) Transcript_53070:3-1373(-)